MLDLSDLETFEGTNPEAMDIVRTAARVGAMHWDHEGEARGGRGTTWIDRAAKLLDDLHTGKFGTQISRDYIATVPDCKQFLAPMPWEQISFLVSKAIRTMFSMPDYAHGTIFYPVRFDRWLLSDNRGTKTSCFLRMLSSESRVPVWTLDDIAKAPSKERAAIARIKDALGADADGLSVVYANIPNPIQESTFWHRVGQVAAWMRSTETQATRTQFGPQAHRSPMTMHKNKWDRVSLASIVRDLVGDGRGWIAVPGEYDFRAYLDRLAMETGVYMYKVSTVREHPAPAMSGVAVVVTEAEKYLADLV